MKRRIAIYLDIEVDEQEHADETLDAIDHLLDFGEIQDVIEDRIAEVDDFEIEIVNASCEFAPKAKAK